jgi:hypothetical protein
MSFTVKKLCLSLTTIMLLVGTLSQVNAAPANKNTYTEDQFLSSFSGKSKKMVSDKLGEPAKKELSVKPSGASAFLDKAGGEDKNSKPVTVEMWYYKNIVKYDPKHTYKETEVTFVNDKVLNIAFFNNR